MPSPLFEIACLEHVSNEPQKSVVVNTFTQDAQEDFVIKSSKRSHNSIPYSTTQKKRTEQRLKSLTPLIPCLGVALR